MLVSLNIDEGMLRYADDSCGIYSTEFVEILVLILSDTTFSTIPENVKPGEVCAGIARKEMA